MYATGWLNWPPDVALNTPFPVIELALEGKVDFLTATTPGAQKRKKWGKKPKSPDELRSKIKAVFAAFKSDKAPE